jgi:hypothetical protein
MRALFFFNAVATGLWPAGLLLPRVAKTAHRAVATAPAGYSTRSSWFPVGLFSGKFAAAWLHRKNRNPICRRKCTKCRTSRVCT